MTKDFLPAGILDILGVMWEKFLVFSGKKQNIGGFVKFTQIKSLQE